MVSLLQGLLWVIQEKMVLHHSHVVIRQHWGFIITYIHKSLGENVSGYTKSIRKILLKWQLVKKEVF